MKDPKLYTLSAVIVGYLLIGKQDSYEQNALGNWFMTVGQILECNSAFLQAINYEDNKTPSNLNNNLSIKDKDDIKDFLNQIQNLLEQIKKEL